MAPNVSYNTLDQAVDIAPERKPEVSTKLAAAVAVCAVVLFFAGRSAPPAEFTHAEVLDVAEFCGDGQFIGKCNTCKKCATYEFDNGGCSFFKDTFCTFCEPIKNCQREQVSCTSRTDSYCHLCDCNDPVNSWNDVEIGRARDLITMGRAKRLGDTFSCYISDGTEADGGTCKPCKVCPLGFYEASPCDPAENEDTVCHKCTECEVGEWVQKACTYQTDTVCRSCDWCSNEAGDTVGMFQAEACDAGTPLRAGSNAVCAECSTCEDGDWVSAYCEAGLQETGAVGTDTQCSKCSTCAGPDDEDEWDYKLWEEHVDGDSGFCHKGQRFPDDPEYVEAENQTPEPHDTRCADCTLPPDVNGCNDDGTGCQMWTTYPCKPQFGRDAEFKICDQCGGYTYMVRECQFMKTEPDTNAVCKPCASIVQANLYGKKELVTGEIEHCAIENTRCSNDGLWFRAAIGIDDDTIERAKAYESTGKDEKDFDMTGASHRMVLSYCATEDKKGACGDSGLCNLEACDAGFMGPNCQYVKAFTSCGADYVSERRAKKGRKWFDDNGAMDFDLYYVQKEGERTPADFIVYCMMMCEENPFCHAFEIRDDGTELDQSGDWTVKEDTICRLFRDVKLISDDKEPEPEKDCWVNMERVDKANIINQLESIAGYVPPPEPLCRGDACKEYGEHNCDTLKDETWCKLSKKCQNHAEIPCIPDPRMIQPRCPEGQSYCYCTGMCGYPGTDKCQEFRTDSLSAKLAASGAKLVLAYDPLTKKGIAHDDCWATDNLHYASWGVTAEGEDLGFVASKRL